MTTKTNGKPRTPTKKEDLIGPAKTAGYQPIDNRWFRRPDDLPLMTWVTIEQMLGDPTIRLGLAMRAAPLRNAQFAYKEKGSDEWIEGVRASNPTVGNYVYRQLKRIWREIDGLLIAQLYGWAGCEVLHRLVRNEGGSFVEINRLLPRSPKDVRALIQNGEICGVRFLRIRGSEGGSVDVGFPNAIFHRHAPQSGRYYGSTILEGAYSPWADKCGPGGALKLRRLAMQQSSLSGRKLYYPDGSTELPTADGSSTVETPNRDVARMIVEQMLAGAVTTLPSNRDDKGNRLWEMEEAKALTGIDFIMRYPKDLDIEELRGMEIPDELIVEGENGSGAWEGKKVPMMAFYGGLDSWLGALVREICIQQLDWLVPLNFGPGHWYEVETKPLAEQVMEQAKANEPKQQAPPQFGGFGRQDGEGPPPPQRMSLDAEEAVGEAVLSAGELVKAAKRTIRKRIPSLNNLRLGVVRMSAEHAPTGGVTLKGKKYAGGEFIPGEVIASLDSSEKAKLEGAKAIAKGRDSSNPSTKDMANLGTVDEQGKFEGPTVAEKLSDFAKRQGKTLDGLAQETGFKHGKQMVDVAEAVKALGHKSLGDFAKQSGFADVKAFVRYGVSDGGHLPPMVREAFAGERLPLSEVRKSA